MAEHNDIEDNNEELELLLRAMDRHDVELIVPPADLWSRIESGVAPNAEAPVISLDARRVQRGRWIGGAAAAVVLAVFGTVMLFAGSDDNVLATASLAYDAKTFDDLGSDASGTAALLRSEGSFVIDLAKTDLPSPTEDADLEVWLIRPDAEGNVADIISLGVIDPNNPGQLIVPATHDPATYFVVDISVEPRDEIATHSGRSILRGPLTET